ncbi:hypothetical protein DCC85_06460 [Paenibacillus sp. CAA11]|uniref:EutP/PduV family microcompartment system protein n=1 Tax=Paenibacillus sp. CAA11 TaxID=1532905 RepID=UPI000D35AADA|nr:hypothetical protein DCC85_06460 [Paenibacillus sp. CAA11]
MKKILIIGIVASGKTTLAKQLSEALNISWYELDGIDNDLNLLQARLHHPIV